METIAEGTLLWQPPELSAQNSVLRRYMYWLEHHSGLVFADYHALHAWSVADLPAFWQSIWSFFALHSAEPYAQVLSDSAMPGARWFAGASLNYAEHLFRQRAPDQPALLFQQEGQPVVAIGWQQLERDVAAVAAALRGWGVGRGDRVVAYLPNIPQAVVAFLACASVGAIWSSCSPDMGAGSVIDRFAQIEPSVLFAVDGYRYAGKAFDRRAVLAELCQALPTLKQTVLVGYLEPDAPLTAGMVRYAELLGGAHTLDFAPVPFDHPLWVLYSSGTTGLPKPIVQGHGGILLEHLKSLALQLDIGPGDRFFWFTTTGWMMWNFLLGGLLVGATVVLYDGSPGWPTMGALWQLAAEVGVSFFGTSAAYLAACMKAGITPGASHDLSRLKALGSTGSPLPAAGFGWVYEQVRRDVWLVSLSGGTDLCTAFVGGCPLLPVYAGEIQCPALGAAVAVFDEQGQPVFDQMGELVLTAPMPSMPLCFWNDPDGRRYRESYFEQFAGVWRHGDWAKLTPRGGVVIYGRSDATINRQGVRIGTSELYRVVEALPAIADSMAIDLEMLGRPSFMALFVVLAEDYTLDEALQASIKQAIRITLSARHLPDAIYAVPAIPRTLNGKKMETPVKKILLGMPVERAANRDSMSDPHSLDPFVALADKLRVEH